MNTLYIFIAAVALLLIGFLIWIGHRRTQGQSGAFQSDGATAPASAGGLPSKAELPFKDADSVPNDNEAVERTKLVIHGLLLNVSEGIETILAGTTEHVGAIEDHKIAVKKAMTIAGIKELERVLLQELDQMKNNSEKYTSQLDDANRKIKSQQETLEKLQTDATMDFLTKVGNRRAFDEHLLDEMGRAKRYGTRFSLVLFDIDHFKTVNDIYGHIAGDRVLRGLAKVVEGEIRTSDFFSRYGGEEFALILPETTLAQAIGVAQKVRKKIDATKFWVDNRNIRVTASAGVAEINPEADTRETFIARADAGLYRAKQNGRNRVDVLPPTPE